MSDSEAEDDAAAAAPAEPVAAKRKRDDSATAKQPQQQQQQTKKDGKQAKALKSENAKTAGGSIAKHKSELGQIKEQDPEFYKYLQKHDESLLEFGEDDDDEVGEAEVEEKHARVRSKRQELTVDMLEKWEQTVRKVAALFLSDFYNRNSLNHAHHNRRSPPSHSSG